MLLFGNFCKMYSTWLWLTPLSVFNDRSSTDPALITLQLNTKSAQLFLWDSGKPIPHYTVVFEWTTCQIFNETLNRTILRSFFTLNQPHKKDHLTLLCRSFNSLGLASQQFCVSSQQISTEHQRMSFLHL